MLVAKELARQLGVPVERGPERWLFEFCVYVMYVAKLAVILFAKTVKLWLSF
jgi:hypothetical protein